MKSKQAKQKIGHFAEDVGQKTRSFVSLGKEKLASTLRSGRNLVHEKKSDIASVIEKEKKKLFHR